MCIVANCGCCFGRIYSSTERVQAVAGRWINGPQRVEVVDERCDGGNWTTPTKETTVENQRKDERVIRRGLGEADVVFGEGLALKPRGAEK